jgi:hypothetical protein
MKVKVLNEAGYDEAVRGIGLSYGIDDFERLETVAMKLASKDGGHNKFLESIVVWFDIDAPRYWWQEFDTYRVGTTKQSGSTMHTLTHRTLTQNDFSFPINEKTLDYLNKMIILYKKETDKDKQDYLFYELKSNLPEGFLQRRIVCTNYKVLRNIIKQRKNHRLIEWKLFVNYVLSHVSMSSFLEDCLD